MCVGCVGSIGALLGGDGAALPGCLGQKVARPHVQECLRLPPVSAEAVDIR